MYITREEFPMMDLIFVLIGLSHVCLGWFGLNHRFKKPIMALICAAYFAFFMGVCYLPITMGWLFLITLGVGAIMCIFVSKDPWYKTLFILTTYTVIFSIFLGACFGIKLLDYEGSQPLKVVLLLVVYAILLVSIYLFFIPRYRRIEKDTNRGWIGLICGNVLFIVLIFLQTIYPFRLEKDEPLRSLIFVVSILTYFFEFHLVFRTLETQHKVIETDNEKKKFETMAQYDSLTSLKNKNAFERYILTLSEDFKSEESNNKIALIMLDINKFKEINDNFGHLEGDEILKNVAITIKDVFFENNYQVFRFGGDEFCIVALNVDGKTLKEKIDELNYETNSKFAVKLAGGYSFVDFKEIDPFRTAFKNADKKMYRNKFD